MPLKRRQFLVFGSLSAVGLGFLWKMLQRQEAYSAQINPVLTPTVAAEKPLLRFVSIADTGTGTTSQYAVAKAMSRYHSQNPYDLVILAGDNIYNNGEIEKIGAVFEQPYQSLLKQGVKFQACLGNHDIRTDNGEPQVRYSDFNMQGRYYTFRRDRVQFFALDTNGNADWEAQLAWLEKELSLSDAPWKVVFGHHQIYSSGQYGVNQPFIKTLTPLFQKYGVQLYINGHDHHYERTRSINGTTYLICGGGAGTRPVGRSEWTEYSASTLSFAAFDVYADRMVVSGIGTDGRVFDRGVIGLRSV
ncbi:metallophosphoesterase [Argonema galeatum]|uniref:metallophosphoesterase n=1 Tax=Argonema galeatum TaxID=2942762 RepID=UPI00201326D6|nr:metallophosphoesterase [Argonema galeatum]MCL1466336.1 metallophosphoesterase [Argonema galeatum A003/A1]